MTALSIVVPCFDEEACLPVLHDRLTKAAQSAIGEDYEIVLINDGSRDKTWGIMQQIAASDPKRLLVDDRAPVHVARGETTDLYAGWVNQLPLLHPVQVDDRTYARARSGVVAYWNRRLADGAQIVVPEDRVMNAERAVLMQQLVQSWRYSVGNPYEELSFAEALDTAQVMAEYGYPTTADGIRSRATANL